MNKIKSILSPGSKKDDEAMYDTGSDQQAPGASGKVTGEGSHFGTGGSGTDSAGYSLGKDTEGHGFTEDEPTGPTDSSGYAIGTGPGATGVRDPGNHMNPASRGADLEEGAGSGQAAVGQSSTYDNQTTSTKDETSRLIDPSSSGPSTLSRPEASATGVGPGAAEIAARRAFDPSSGSMPGGFPEEDTSNPYAASHLDPRVDSAGHAPVTQTHAGRDAEVGVGAGAGAAAVGAYEASRRHEPTTSATAPSTLTSTANPTERSQAYESATESRGLDLASAPTESSYAPTSSSTTAMPTTDNSTEKKGMVGTVLGALGLGGGAAAAKYEHDKDSAVDSNPSTATGVGSYSTPSESVPSSSHRRKESIPTTAYPSGNLDSVRPIAGPTGQTSTPESSAQHYGTDAAIGSGALGTAALGVHEYDKSREPTGGAGDTTSKSGIAGTSSAAPQTSTVYDLVTGGTPETSQSTGMTSSSYPGTSQPYGTTSGPGTGLAATAGTTGATVPSAAGQDSHHYGRDAAIGGGALGAAGLGAHEYESSRARTGGTSGVTPTSQHYGNQSFTNQGDTQEFSNKVDPRTDAAGNANSGTGITAVPTTIPGRQNVSQPTTGLDTQDFSNKVDPRTDAAGNANRGTGITAVPTTTPSQVQDQHHYGRDAAVVGGGAAAAGYGAHEYDKHEAEEAEKGRNRLQKSQKAQEKELKKEQKAEEKAEKKHEKELAKEEKKHEKALAKEEKQHEKMLEKDERRHEKEGAAAIGAGAVGAGSAYEYEKHHQPTTGTSGGELSSAGMADRETYDRQNRYTATSADPGVDPTIRQPSTAAGAGSEHHYGRDAALGAAGAGTVGAGAYEAEKHHQPSTSGAGGRLAAADAADREAYNRQNRYTATMADPGVDPTVRKPSIAASSGAGHHYGRDAAVGGIGAGAVGTGAYEAEKYHESSQMPTTTSTSGTQGTDPYYNRHQVPDSAVAGQQTTSIIPTDNSRHYGRDAAVSGAGAAVIGGGAYEVEKHHERGTTDTGRRHSGLAAADEDDRKVYGRDEREKKPGFFKRIFKRKKNPHTGESEDDEDNYEDVPHDHHPGQHGTAATATATDSPTTAQTAAHEEGDMIKPSYNPFRKEDPNVRPVEGRI